MLPYAALMLHLRWDDGTEFHTCALAPSVDGVLFRASEARRHALAGGPASAVVSVLRDAEGRYETIELSGFTLTEEAPDEETAGLCLPGSLLWRLSVSDSAFAAAMRRLLADYSAYAELKQTEEEPGLMSALTGLRAGEPEAGSAEEWKYRQTASAPMWEEPLLPVQLAAALDGPAMYRAFLRLDPTEFAAYYWRTCALESHPISRVALTHVHIGSSFCFHLFPDTDTLQALLLRARSLGLKPAVVLPPMPERLTERFRDLLLQLDALAAREACVWELVLNDMGTALLLRELAAQGMLSAGHFALTAGVLLDKHTADPRLPAQPGGERLSDRPGISPCYAAYLKDRLGFTALSCEVSSRSLAAVEPDSWLHLPLYQTNTAPACPIFGLCRSGSRGKGLVTADCPRYCEHYALVYPDSLHMIGLRNSLFGCSMTELNSSAELNRLIRAGVRRLVVHL